MVQEVRFKKMDESISRHTSKGDKILSDCVQLDGAFRKVIMTFGSDSIRSSVHVLQSWEWKIGEEKFSEMVISFQDVEIMSAYFNNQMEDDIV
ncbi:hypothetical protein EEL30_00285 (plasmid) [Brevibacillus laterosporus]|uniref:Uncharacterized protein n=1 Tax=Brevibacillus laterosporus TaxID=1465 RepID=A0A518V1U6_BRELA|nr:hypothetical protein EEL30_00285 [Brevibacillus laterosporus]